MSNITYSQRARRVIKEAEGGYTYQDVYDALTNAANPNHKKMTELFGKTWETYKKNGYKNPNAKPEQPSVPDQTGQQNGQQANGQQEQGTPEQQVEQELTKLDRNNAAWPNDVDSAFKFYKQMRLEKKMTVDQIGEWLTKEGYDKTVFFNKYRPGRNLFTMMAAAGMIKGVNSKEQLDAEKKRQATQQWLGRDALRNYRQNQNNPALQQPWVAKMVQAMKEVGVTDPKQAQQMLTDAKFNPNEIQAILAANAQQQGGNAQQQPQQGNQQQPQQAGAAQPQASGTAQGQQTMKPSDF